MEDIEATGGMQDPRRTEVGNRIDPSLAKGFVKQMLKRAERMMTMPSPAELGEFRNPKARLRAIKKIQKVYGEKLFATVSSKDYTRVDFVLFYSAEIAENHQLGVFCMKYDLQPKSDMPSMHWIDYPLMAIGTYAYLTKHSLIRLSQRGGARTFDDFLSLVRPFWAWSSVAHDISHTMQRDLHWFLPTQSGLFAVRTKTSIVADPKSNSGKLFTTSSAKTYIDRSDMRPSNQEIWDRLTGMGILDATPRFPRLSAPKQEEISMMGAMIAEGKKWYDRYEYAVKKGTEAEANPFD